MNVLNPLTLPPYSSLPSITYFVSTPLEATFSMSGIDHANLFPMLWKIPTILWARIVIAKMRTKLFKGILKEISSPKKNRNNISTSTNINLF